MSNWREQLTEEQETKAVMTWLEDYYHVPVLIGLIGFLFWNRIRNRANYVIDGTTYFSGNDPWYHYRMTQYTVENFPATMPFEPWTHFPFGTATGQFGTIYNQAIALVALILGLGNPSEGLVVDVFLIAPALVALLICIPAYLIGRRLGGRVGGIFAIGMIAFAPDRLLTFTLAGHVDHHAVEVLFMSLSILGVMVALTAAEKEKPVWELVTAREFDALRGTIGWSMLAGLGMALYMWAWPPGVWTLGILAVFFTIHMSVEHLRGRSPEHTAFVGVISALTAGVLQMGTVRNIELAVASRSILHPLFGFAVAIGVVFLAYLSRQLDARDQPQYAYPAAVFGLIVVAAVSMALLLPGLFDFLYSQVDRVLGFVTSPGTAAGTIGEAQPMDFSNITDTYHFALFTAGLGAAVLLLKQVLDREPKGEHLLILVWAAFLLAATLTQRRFAVYLTIPVGVLNAALVAFVIKLTGTPDREFDIESYQILTVLVILLVVFGPLVGLPLISADTTAMEQSDSASRPGTVVVWDNSLQWMNENTPLEGQYGSPDNEPMEFYGTYEEQDDFEYPDGSYGVISWWDYGHWITTRAERIPTANPFQEGARSAARFLLAQNESTGLDVLSEVDESQDVQTRYVMVDWKMVESTSDRPIRGKFFAPVQFHDDYGQSDFYKRLAQINQRGGFRHLAMIHNQPYYESMVARLYHYHGSAKEPKPMVVEWSGQEQQFETGPLEGQSYVQAQSEGQSVQIFDNMSAARQYVQNTPSAQIGGIGPQPTERVEALDRFRLVHMNPVSAVPTSSEQINQFASRGIGFGKWPAIRTNIWQTGLGNYFQQQIASQNPDAGQQQVRQQAQRRALNFLLDNTPAWTKTFERVPGATIQISGPENQTVQVNVQLNPENGRNFTYSQRAQTGEDGTVELTVPYSTTGYDELGVEEGYTEPSVKAGGPYRISSGLVVGDNGTAFRYSGTANVTEAQVLGEDTDPVTVTLEKQELNLGGGQEDDGSGESGDGSSDSEDGTTESGESSSEDSTSSGDGSEDSQKQIDPRGGGPLLAAG